MTAAAGAANVILGYVNKLASTAVMWITCLSLAHVRIRNIQICFQKTEIVMIYTGNYSDSVNELRMTKLVLSVIQCTLSFLCFNVVSLTLETLVDSANKL